MGAAVTSPVCCINIRPEIEKQKTLGFHALRGQNTPFRRCKHESLGLRIVSSVLTT